MSAGSGDDNEKGFLADDDLLGELDAWDRTFDALHEEDSAKASAGAAGAAQVADEGQLTPVPGEAPGAAASPSLSPSPHAPAQASPSPAPHVAPTRAPSIFPTPVPAQAPSFPSPFAGQPAAAPSTGPAFRPGPFDSPFEGSGGDEADFSDIGFAGEPEALGSLLGVPPPLPPLDEASGTAAAVVPPAPAPPVVPPRRAFVPVRPPSSPGFDDEDEDSVFTSASRPIVRVSQPRVPTPPPTTAPPKLEASPTDEELFGDLPSDLPSGAYPKVAPAPAAPAARAPVPAQGDMTRVADANMALFDEHGFADAGAQRTRIADPNLALIAETRGAPGPADPRASRGPAIVRRTDRRSASRIEVPAPEDHDDFAGPEATRVADLNELEKMAAQQREEASAAAAAFFAADDAPAIVLEADEDFYADIEIGGGGGDEPDDKGTPSALGRRTTAHVVRRAGGGAGSEGVVVELEADDDHELTRKPSRVMAAAAAPAPAPDDVAMSVDEALADIEAVPAAVPAEEDFSGVAPTDDEVAGLSAAEDDFSDVAAAVASRTVPLPVAASGSGRTFTADVAAAAAVAAGRAAQDTGFPEERTPVPGGEAAAPLAPGPGAIEAVAAAIAGVEDEGPTIAFEAVPAATGETMSGAIAAATAVPGLVEAVSAALSPAGPAPTPAAAPAVEAVPAPAPRERSGPELAPELPPPRLVEPDLALDLDAIALPERVDPTAGMDLTEAAAQSLLILERELEGLDDGPAAAAVRIEAGRLGERVGDVERARLHYEAALLADPRATPALRGLRRIARAVGDLGEATTHLDVELALAGPLERRALTLHRVDLLMAAGEQDLARVAVGELLDEAPGDVRALLAQLELAFLDGRADEFGESLQHLAAALVDPALRAAVETARGHLDERPGGDAARAGAAFAAAATSDPSSRVARVAASRIAIASGNRTGQVAATLALAGQVSASDPISAAGLGLRAAQ
jgi:hypothetical protein